MKDIDFIKNFSKIKISHICDSKKINRGNLLSGKSTAENERYVRECIEDRLAHLYLKENDDVK